MNANAIDDLLVLAKALTRRTNQLCAGLESGIANIYELVTPVTSELLRWWFGDDACQSRTFNFHAGQRQAILNVIVAHEVLDSPDLPDLYRQVCAETLLARTRHANGSSAGRPRSRQLIHHASPCRSAGRRDPEATVLRRAFRSTCRVAPSGAPTGAENVHWGPMAETRLFRG